MCFSAEASFTAAGITGLAGVIAVTRIPSLRLLPLAGVPVVFAAQQAIEGTVWLSLANGASESILNSLSKSFLIVGEALWPLLIPFAAYLAEVDPSRRRVLLGATVAGTFLAIAFSFLIISASYTPEIRNGCIAYAGEVNRFAFSPEVLDEPTTAWRLSGLDWTVLPYALLTIGSLFLSSHMIVRLFAVVCAVGLAVSLALYRETLVSVWCFFAAFASGIILFAIERAREEARGDVVDSLV